MSTEIRNRGLVAGLVEQFGGGVRRAPKYQNRHLFGWDQEEQEEMKEVVMALRGLIKKHSREKVIEWLGRLPLPHYTRTQPMVPLFRWPDGFVKIIDAIGKSFEGSEADDEEERHVMGNRDFHLSLINKYFEAEVRHHGEVGRLNMVIDPLLAIDLIIRFFLFFLLKNDKKLFGHRPR